MDSALIQFLDSEAHNHEIFHGAACSNRMLEQQSRFEHDTIPSGESPMGPIGSLHSTFKYRNNTRSTEAIVQPPCLVRTYTNTPVILTNTPYVRYLHIMLRAHLASRNRFSNGLCPVLRSHDCLCCISGPHS